MKHTVTIKVSGPPGSRRTTILNLVSGTLSQDFGLPVKRTGEHEISVEVTDEWLDSMAVDLDDAK